MTTAETMRRAIRARDLQVSPYAEVLGAAHVDSVTGRRDRLLAAMQELVTEYCWGAVWTRDGLDRKTRSLLNLAMLTALNRSHELGAHVRGALNNGVHRGRDSRSAAADRRLLRRAGGAGVVPGRRQDHRGDDRR